MATKKERLDVVLVRQGLAPDEERARALIMAGEVFLGDRRIDKPGTLVPANALCRLVGPSEESKYVSRAGLKLEKALQAFDLRPAGQIVLDVGASTGGFTDCLLRNGANKVYALDVGRGLLAWQLRNDPRVAVMEQTNIRHVTSLSEPVPCAVIDVSFISLRLVLPVVAALLATGGWIVALVKPQFEASKIEVDRGKGVISDPEVHERILTELQTWIREQTVLEIKGLTDSPIHGRDGNKEFLLHLTLR